MSEPRKPWITRRLLWITAGAFLVSLTVSAWLIGAAPREIVLATGDPEGGFAVLGKKYQERLDRMGLKVRLVESTGSLENLKMLRFGDVDVAFVQGGLSRPGREETSVWGLAAITSEPLWIFSRDAIHSLHDLRGKRIILGPAVSGTDAIGRQLLGQFGVDEKNSTFLNQSMGESYRALVDQSADAVLLICSAEAPIIGKLIQEPGVHLVSLHYQNAISRRMRFLRAVTLPGGTFDLEKRLPPRDTALVAPVTLLAAREDLHPRVVEQLLIAAKTIHDSGDLLEEKGRYPSLDGMDLPVHITADRFMKHGESFLSRILPYRAMRFVWQIQILVLPILTLVPLWKALPLLYVFRINQILKRHYIALGEVEEKINNCNDPEILQQSLDAFDQLRNDLERLSRKMPAHMQRDIYHWRLHVAMVRDEARERLKKMREESTVTVNGEGSQKGEETANDSSTQQGTGE